MIRRILLSLLIIIGLAANSHALVRNIQDDHKVVYHVIDSSGDHVGSQTVTLKIQRVSDGAWFDFNDSSFKTSAWTSKSTNLTEDSTEGFYHYTFNPPAGETSAEQYVFLVDNADATYGDHQSEVVSYQDLNPWDDSTRTLTAGTKDAEIDSILTDTNELQTDDVPGLIAALNDVSTAEVNTQVDTALSDIGLDHLLSASVAGTDVTDNSIIAYMVSKSATADWDSFRGRFYGRTADRHPRCFEHFRRYSRRRGIFKRYLNESQALKGEIMDYLKKDSASTLLITIPGSSSGDTVTYNIYDTSGTVLASGNMTFVVDEIWSVSYDPSSDSLAVGDRIVLKVNDTTITSKRENYYEIVTGDPSIPGSESSTSVVAMCNAALVQLGKPTIVSLDDNNENARRCKVLYDQVRRMVLEAHPWNGCTKQAELNLLSSTPEFEWSYIFQLPTDCLRPVKSDQDVGNERLWEQKGDKIYTDHGTLKMEYIYDCKDTTLFSQGLRLAISARLEAELAYTVTGSTTLAETKLAIYQEIKLPEAKSIDAQVGRSQRQDDEYDAWEQSRYA